MAREDRRPPLPLEWFDDIKPRLDGLWLIKKLLPAIGLVLIYGHPGSGKSFLALDIAFHVALGRSWNGRRVKRGLAIYVGAEGGDGLRNRMVVLGKHYGVAKIPLALIDIPIDLQNPDADTPRLIEAIRAAAERSRATPALIVIDTLSKTFGAGKENTDDMAVYVANCQRVATEFGCCVMPVHHRPKDEASVDPRGHGSLKSGVDTVILVEAGNPKRVSVTKQKDADPAEDMAFDLEQVTIGEDEDGEAVTSCIVRFSDAPAPRGKGNPARLTGGQAITLRELIRTIVEKGEIAPADLPADLSRPGLTFKVAREADWRARVIAAIGAPDQSRDHTSRMFRKYKKRLQELKIIEVWGDYVWNAS